MSVAEKFRVSGGVEIREGNLMIHSVIALQWIRCGKRQFAVEGVRVWSDGSGKLKGSGFLNFMIAPRWIQKHERWVVSDQWF